MEYEDSDICDKGSVIRLVLVDGTEITGEFKGLTYENEDYPFYVICDEDTYEDVIVSLRHIKYMSNVEKDDD